MTITLYNNKSDKHVLNKSIAAAAENVTVTITDECEILRPVLVVSTATANIDTANYLYISAWGRYYYINDKTTILGGRVMLHCTVDVLMSHASGIRNLTGTVDRQENKYNGYLIDSEYIAKAYKQITAKTFPSGLTNDSLILMTVG